MSSLPENRSILADLDRVLDAVPRGYRADVRLVAATKLTMRYANSAIHQPHAQSGQSLSVRVERGKRLATATTSDLTDLGIKAVIDEAVRLGRVAPVERRFRGFPAPGASSGVQAAFSASTAGLSPERVARLALDALDGARQEAADSRISGVVNAGGSVRAVGNTSGVRRAGRRSFVQGTVLVDRPSRDPPPSGWSEGAHWSVERFDSRALGREAALRMPREPPAAVAPGAYRVVLRGPAASELLGFLAFLGFGGHGEEEGWSCLRGRRGRPGFPTWLDLRDDGGSRATLPTSFDFEGIPKRPIPLITRGRAGAAVTDIVTAGRLGVRPTGHALPPEAPWGESGPLPSNLVVRPGDRTEEELLEEVGSGLLVTRFHYVRVVHPGRGEITGTTRDGTYRVENGKVVGPVRNLRFTDSVVGATQRLLAAGREVRCFADEDGSASISCPSLAVERFQFTSSTIF